MRSATSSAPTACHEALPPDGGDADEAGSKSCAMAADAQQPAGESVPRVATAPVTEAVPHNTMTSQDVAQGETVPRSVRRKPSEQRRRGCMAHIVALSLAAVLIALTAVLGSRPEARPAATYHPNSVCVVPVGYKEASWEASHGWGDQVSCDDWSDTRAGAIGNGGAEQRRAHGAAPCFATPVCATGGGWSADEARLTVVRGPYTPLWARRPGNATSRGSATPARSTMSGAESRRFKRVPAPSRMSHLRWHRR